MGLASDGASVMTGVTNGVGVRLRRDITALVGIHCVAHRLALATNTAKDDSPEIMRYATVIR